MESEQLKQEFNRNDDEDKFLFDAALKGVEVEKFLSSSVGRLVVERARREVQEFTRWALRESAQATFKDFAEKREKAYVAKTLINWLFEILVNGETAHSELQVRQTPAPDDTAPAAPGMFE